MTTIQDIPSRNTEPSVASTEGVLLSTVTPETIRDAHQKEIEELQQRTADLAHRSGDLLFYQTARELNIQPGIERVSPEVQRIVQVGKELEELRRPAVHQLINRNLPRRVLRELGIDSSTSVLEELIIREAKIGTKIFNQDDIAPDEFWLFFYKNFDGQPEWVLQQYKKSAPKSPISTWRYIVQFDSVQAQQTVHRVRSTAEGVSPRITLDAERLETFAAWVEEYKQAVEPMLRSPHGRHAY